MTVESGVKRCPQYLLRKLIFRTLDASITYAGSVVPVFEATPKGMPFPYIVIGKATWAPDPNKSYFVDAYEVEMYVLTDYGGTLENVAILGQLYEQLSAGLQGGALQFASKDGFCIQMAYFKGGSTEVSGNDSVYPSLLEQSTQTVFFEIIQTW